MGATPLWTRDAVATRILAGEYLVIYRSHLLRIPLSWLDAHPGGSLAILHFVGRDATDEIDAYHCDDTRRLVEKYSVGRVECSPSGWVPLVPPIMSGWVRRQGVSGKMEWYQEATIHQPLGNSEIHPPSQILLVGQESDILQSSTPTLSTLSPPTSHLCPKIQAQHSSAYKELHKRIVDAGLYKTPYLTGYGPEVLRYLLLASLSTYAYIHGWLVTSAICLGLMWHQLVFSAHDLGHMGVTHNWVLDRLLAIFIADFIGGLSIGCDPDIEHLPFFAISPTFFSSLWSSYYKRTMHFDRFAAYFISLQHKIFYLVMAFARFNLYANSYTYLYRKAWDTRRARGGVLGLVFFWCWFGAILYGCGSWKKALTYLIVSHAVTSPLHVQIVLSHFSMSTKDLGPVESFPHRQMRTTTDVICPPSLGFIHGGLQLQVTHHLFPRLPRHNLARASVLVKEFAAEQGIVYAEFGFVAGNQEVLGVLKNVAEQVKLIGRVADAEAREAIERKIHQKCNGKMD
ncbi:delta 8-sphingoloid desaturase protein [Infundibulicybe gibba]|nr:delta 8-sphingoloid desaturase protein [Infundibulicybe gibba]